MVNTIHQKAKQLMKLSTSEQQNMALLKDFHHLVQYHSPKAKMPPDKTLLIKGFSGNRYRVSTQTAQNTIRPACAT
jgi:hypothetical protein